MIKELVESSYGLRIDEINLLDKHFGTTLYSAVTDKGNVIIKTLPLNFQNIENEGSITEYLSRLSPAEEGRIKVPKFYRTNDGSYAKRTEKFYLTVQERVEGRTPEVNTAPDWLLERSAEIFGRIVIALKDYGELPLRCGADFFTSDNALTQKAYSEKALAKCNDETVAEGWRERIRQLERIAGFDIDTNRLTYSNSHGDFYIGQLIVNRREVAVIDWSSACRLPVCLEVIMSYAFANPACAGGEIDTDGLVKYAAKFCEYFPLNEYDIKMMPYLYFYWQTMCNYSPDEMANLPENYRAIAGVITRLLAWLYDNAEGLSRELASRSSEITVKK